jgi:hypothetical protein
MESNTKPSLMQTTLTWGLITGFAGIIFSLILYFADMSLNKTAGYFSIIITFIGIYLGTKACRDQVLGGYISYSRALGIGTLITLFSTILAIIYVIILYKVIDPGLINKTMEMSQEQMIERGQNIEQMEKGLEIARKFFVLFASIGVFFFSMFAGFVVSLITSAILKKDGDSFTKDMSAIKPE